jgi:ATP/maltotriose-dependent transcriptional regulator MalT
MLQQAVSTFRSRDVSGEEELRWLWLAGLAAVVVWDDESWDVLTARHVQLAREAGAFSVLPVALTLRIGAHTLTGELLAAVQLIEEARTLTEVLGSYLPPYAPLILAAWRGREAEASKLIEETLREVASRGEGQGVAAAQWARAVLYNGLGRYEEALAAARLASEHPEGLAFSNTAPLELIEAAVRTGQTKGAAGTPQRLSERTSAGGTDWALGVEARSRALLSEGEFAERLYREAIERLGRTHLRAELARAHLLYGEWLRRENRRVDAREQLRGAYRMLTTMGIEAFAQRSRRELLATGETVRKRTVDAAGELTPQEAQIARLAADGHTNPEMSTRLFISPRTVEWHLRKVFTKLGISSRRQLRQTLPRAGRADIPA